MSPAVRLLGGIRPALAAIGLAVGLAVMAAALPAAAAEPFDPFAIGFQPPEDARLPGSAQLVDRFGTPVRLSALLGERPVILAPVYYTCPNVCGVTLAGLFDALGHVPLEPGRDFTVLAVSIHPEEGPAEARAAADAARQRYRGEMLDGAVHFLTGSEAAIAAVMTAIGFDYRWDPERQEYAHAAGVVVATADGRLARWLPGVTFQPSDLRLAVLEAGEGRIGSLTDQLLLLCYHYDPASGQYNSIVQGSLQVGGVLTVLAVGGFIGRSLWRDRRHKAAERERGEGG